METSKKFGFSLPSGNSDDIVDINQISDNFRIIDENVPSTEDLKNIKINIDQTYNPASENAQSGKAVAEALKTVEVDLSDYPTYEEVNNAISQAITTVLNTEV